MRRFLYLLLFLQIATALYIDGFVSEERQELIRRLEMQPSVLREGDIVVNPSNSGVRHSAIKNVGWTNGNVALLFSSSIARDDKKKVEKAINTIEALTCVNFSFASPTTQDYIAIVRKPSGSECSSSIGKIGGVQLLTLSSGCYEQRTILHELMHALGFEHEHSRSDRDNYVNINWDNIQHDMRANYNKRNWTEMTLLDTPYAYESIMHYQGHEFAINKQVPTLVSKQGRGYMGGGDTLSDIDVKRINRYYNCNKEPTVPPTVPSTVPPPPPPPQPTSLTVEFCANGGDPTYHCIWTSMTTAGDAGSQNHYYRCVPNNSQQDMRCGSWVRQACFAGTQYDRQMGGCVAVATANGNQIAVATAFGGQSASARATASGGGTAVARASASAGWNG